MCTCACVRTRVCTCMSMCMLGRGSVQVGLSMLKGCVHKRVTFSMTLGVHIIYAGCVSMGDMCVEFNCMCVSG